MRIFSVLIILLFPFLLHAQVICSSEDQTLLKKQLEEIAQLSLDSASSGEVAATIGKRFLGTPYVGKTLEVGENESLVINLHGLDCTTFLENVVVLTRLQQEQDLSVTAFQQALTELRYRSGTLEGYPSRLHYFSEWLIDNEKKGWIKNITLDIGGVPYKKKIDFMSTHRSSYARLEGNDANWQDIREVEVRLNQQSFFYIPKDYIRNLEDNIATGDLIAIATSIQGLDVVHTGFAYRKNGRVHLLHASTGSKQVEISAKPLYEYMAGIRHQSGIMVARLNAPTK
ncbi:MAG: N-acetylmuramoyl-L-alanine amidase-like domain-containing protein [Bacteroidota bacterium]